MTFEQRIEQYMNGCDYADAASWYHAVSAAAMDELKPHWQAKRDGKRAAYLSAEFLMGRMVDNNLANLGLLDRAQAVMQQHGESVALFEKIDDDALGNGGLGRLAACFLDAAATHDIPLDGYGIRYRYGLFRQSFNGGFQHESPDDWLRFGDPWSIRRGDRDVTVQFADQTVRAKAYDMPIIGYGGKTVNTLRLWEADAVSPLDFEAFNAQEYDRAMREENKAKAISAVLYPNDDTGEGKRLRLKQQYFFAAASLYSMLRDFKDSGERDIARFPDRFAIQLNDTHPTVAIPELLRLLMTDYRLPFDKALDIVQRTFAYTNHPIMAEALETWDVPLFCSVIPEVYPYIVMLHLHQIGTHGDDLPLIVDGGRIHMARMAIYATHSTNGVARIHTDLLTSRVLAPWAKVFPDRFSNKTNGITPRRWLMLCNPELSSFITDRLGDGWITDLDQLAGLRPYVGDDHSLRQFIDIKQTKKTQLCRYIAEREGVTLSPDWMFDVQAKRLHEYKRQLLNALSLLDIYFGIKDGTITDFYPTVFLFGAKAAPGYRRAKGIIKFINEIAALIRRDADVCDKMQVLFVQNYDVSYAEKLLPAADISEQISTAGTEASGTGNMKLMLNGAVTLGTFDGANIEIFEQAGEENNYVFGATVEEIDKAKDGYSPLAIYEYNPRIRRVLDTLIDGTFDDGGSGVFRELYNAILRGASWHAPDHYFVLLDLIPYTDARLAANRDYRDRLAFAKKQLANVAAAGKFSADRTIREYASEIWGV